MVKKYTKKVTLVIWVPQMCDYTYTYMHLSLSLYVCIFFFYNDNAICKEKRFLVNKKKMVFQVLYF